MAKKAEPTIPAKEARAHKATYASDKRNPGQYNIRVLGPHAKEFTGRTIPVTRKDDTESMETLTKCFWAGVDEETGKPVALYNFEQKPKEEELNDAIPF